LGSALASNLLEAPSIVGKRGGFAAQLLPALDDDVHVLLIEFDSAADPPGEFRGGERGTASEERIIDQLARLV
jgi:hypothetical protein